MNSLTLTLVKYDKADGFYPGGNVDTKNSKDLVVVNMDNVTHVTAHKDRKGTPYYQVNLTSGTYIQVISVPEGFF